MTRRRSAVAAGLGGALLAGSWLALRSPALQRVDVRAGDAVRRSGSAGLDEVVRRTTDLGSMYAVVGMAATLAATGRRRLAADVLGAGAVAWAVAQASKTGVRRQRPYEADGVRRLVSPPSGSSFPSGHAAVAVAVMTVAGGQARPPGGCLLLALGGYVAASRVYVGVHYPTDVIGGAGLGLVLGALWRGTVAASGRRLVGVSAGAVPRVGLPLTRLAARVVLGVRPGGPPSRPRRRSRDAHRTGAEGR